MKLCPSCDQDNWEGREEEEIHNKKSHEGEKKKAKQQLTWARWANN